MSSESSELWPKTQVFSSIRFVIWMLSESFAVHLGSQSLRLKLAGCQAAAEGTHAHARLETRIVAIVGMSSFSHTFIWQEPNNQRNQHDGVFLCCKNQTIKGTELFLSFLSCFGCESCLKDSGPNKLSGWDPGTR